QEGKAKQATGNAIERLGKNLTGIKAMMNYEKITPFICFGWGCDFAIDAPETLTVRSKIIVLNEFYNLNQIYVFKRDGNSDVNYFSPVSMFFREERWTIPEMFEKMKEIAEAAIRYYLY
ncbi:MAG: restriction endonuclease, partial [Treponema sp.]|nr:restriction endonuclease [Treponema sp.]